MLAWFLWEWAHSHYRFYFVVATAHARPRTVRRTEGRAHPLGRRRVRRPGPRPAQRSRATCPTSSWPTGSRPMPHSSMGPTKSVVALSADQPATLAYRLQCPVPGELRFEGVRVRIADRQGFFYHRTLIRGRVRVPSPAAADRGGGQAPRVEAPQHLPAAGRSPPSRRPGGGSELLDLRDYIPGDPPKMIAWKPSARKDKLFTKEFESEVPVRCTLFVDASESTRLGSKRTKITRLANLAAGVAEAAVADRDHAGLVVFDEHDAQVMRPKRSRRHVIDMLTPAGQGGRPADADRAVRGRQRPGPAGLSAGQRAVPGPDAQAGRTRRPAGCSGPRPATTAAAGGCCCSVFPLLFMCCRSAGGLRRSCSLGWRGTSSCSSRSVLGDVFRNLGVWPTLIARPESRP